MSAHDSPLSVSGRRTRHTARTVAFTLTAVAAAGAACVWAADRAAAVDRPLVTATGGLSAALIGVAVALAMSRHRLARELRVNTEVLRDEAARTVALHVEAARRATVELEGAQRAVREARVRRRTSAESEASLRTALRAETARTAALEGETARLAEVTIPLAVDRLRAGGSADTVLSRLPLPTGAAHQRLLDVLVREIGASERMRAAGMAACASAASRVQALTTGMLADLRELEQRHDERVLGDLLRLDHCTAQAGRLADSVAVLTGSRSGRRWTKPIVMENVLRGAMGRIHAYQRVRLHSASDLAVAGHAAEGVMHALAELMDNACNFSPPTEEVHVYVQETQSGLVVIIEDAGLAMPEATLVRAEKLVSGDPLDIRSLSGTRLGLAVVGCLARKYGLTVSFRPSSRGGTGVVVLIPSKIVVRGPGGYDGLPEADEPEYPARDGRGRRVRRDPTAPPAEEERTGPREHRRQRDRDMAAPDMTAPDMTAPPRHAGGGEPGGPAAPMNVAPVAPAAHVTPMPVAPVAPAPAAPAPAQERSPAHARPAAATPTGPSGALPWSPTIPSGAVPWDTAGPVGPVGTGGPAPAAVPPERPERPSVRPPEPLPRRSRGQTLAASQHGDLTADPSAAWLDPSPEDEARAARARAAAGSRFSAFREAATGGERVRQRTDGPTATSGRPSEEDEEEAATAGRTAARTAGDPAGGGRADAERGPERGPERGTARTADGRTADGRGAEYTGAPGEPQDRTTTPRTPPGGTDTVNTGGDTGR